MDERTKVIRQDKNSRRDKKPSRPRRFSIGRFIVRLLLVVILILLAVAVIAGGAAIGFLAGVMRDLPPIDELGAPRPSLTSFVYSADGEVIAELHRTENRVPITLDQVPVDVQNAFLACEDHRFWEHRGADPIRIVRALWVDIQTRSWAEGASTITQQVVKNAYTHPGKEVHRKVQDLILAIQMERRYTKEEILEMYLNLAFFGHDAHGIHAAAQTYFGKEVEQLTVAEGAMLAGLLRAPNMYSPYIDRDAAISRQQLVLSQMVRFELLSEQEAEPAKRQQLHFVGLRSRHESYLAPHFTDYVLQQLVTLYGAQTVYEGGLHVHTTIDMRLQRAAEQAVAEILDEDFPLGEEEQPEMAVVLLDPHTGHILAMVGGRTHSSRLELNRAMQSYRQPGSAFKPIISYAPAVDMGFTAGSIVDDAPVQYRQFDGSIWAPMNYDFRFRGLTTFRDGLAASINVMAVRLLDRVGVRTGLEYVQKLGINSMVLEGPINDLNLASSLGGLTRGVSPIEMTTAFGVFSTDGIKATPFGITRVVDKNGTVLDRFDPQLEVALRPGTGYIITDMLITAVESGTGGNARIPPHHIAGKTGTTSDHVDAWFVGYSPDFACGVWMGFDQPQDMDGVWGGTYPARVFNLVMTAALENVEPRPFPKPSGLIEGLVICTKSGMRVGPLCPPEHRRSEIFLRGTQPQGECTVHVERTVCKESGKLATDHCPPDSTTTRVFIQRHEPFTPYTNEKGRTFIPADAVLEAPRDTCDFHAPVAVPDEPPVDNGDDDNGHNDEHTEEPASYSDAAIFNMTAQQYAFYPGQLRVKLGQTVIIYLTSIDVEHGLAIPSFGVNVKVAPGETVVITFTADQAGIHAFHCPANCGPGNYRMVGQLIVSQ